MLFLFKLYRIYENSEVIMKAFEKILSVGVAAMLVVTALGCESSDSEAAANNTASETVIIESSEVQSADTTDAVTSDINSTTESAPVDTANPAAEETVDSVEVVVQ